MSADLLILSKSTWDPALRREHALSLQAAAGGAKVLFVERPLDARSLIGTGSRALWARVLLGRADPRPAAPGVHVVPTATLAPGHRSPRARRAETALRARALRGVEGVDTLVATTPWQWPLARRLPARRRVFDCADDWTALMPERRDELAALYSEVAAEADAVVVASPGLVDLFGPGQAKVVRNGVGRDVLDPAFQPAPSEGLMVYVGTISERFDVALVRELLALLPGWRMELHGQCQFPGRGERPSPELESLLREAPVTWRGVAPREGLHALLDRGAVLVLPHVTVRGGDTPEREGSWRGDSMKFYDYAARGRPIVSTPWGPRLAEEGPPGLRLAGSAAEFAACVREAAGEPEGLAADRRAWAAERTWEIRWREWKAAIGEAVPAATRRDAVEAS